MSTAATAGATPANQVQVQVRAGVVSMSAGVPVKVITFSAPMITTDYTVLLEPTGTPQVAAISNKTVDGFTLTLHANATVRWLAVYAI